MKTVIRTIALSLMLLFTAAGTAKAQTTPQAGSQPQTTVNVTYPEAVAIWTAAQPMFWPDLRMTVSEMLNAYFRLGEGEIVKIAEKTYRAEMGGCIGILVIADSL